MQVSLLEETIEPRKNLPYLLVHLRERRPEKLHYIGVSFGLTLELLRFWKKHNFFPFFIGHTPVKIKISSLHWIDNYMLLLRRVNFLLLWIRVLWRVSTRVWSLNRWPMMMLEQVDLINGAFLDHISKVCPFFPRMFKLFFIFVLTIFLLFHFLILVINLLFTDFRLRFLELLGDTFRAMEYKLAMR